MDPPRHALRGIPTAPLQVSLSRHDLFHAHLFFGPHGSHSPNLGLLLHAHEYPKKHFQNFPYDLG